MCNVHVHVGHRSNKGLKKSCSNYACNDKCMLNAENCLFRQSYGYGNIRS